MGREDPKSYIIMVCKWALVAIMLIAVIVHGMRNRISGTSFEDMRDAVLQVTDQTNMNEGDNQMIRRLYGLDANDYDGILLYYPKTNMNAEELFLVRMKDRSQADTVRKAISARLGTQEKSFAGYGADQTAMLENSITEIRGNYAIFISAEDPQTIRDAFDKAY